MPTELTVSKSFTFEASHILPQHRGKCSRLHGHSWGLTVSVKGPVEQAPDQPHHGMVVDFSDLGDLVNLHVISKLDHTHLGHDNMSREVEVDPVMGQRKRQTFSSYFGRGFYPTSENLCHAIARILQPLIKELSPDVRLHAVEIRETCTSSARWCHDDQPTFANDNPGPDGCTF